MEGREGFEPSAPNLGGTQIHGFEVDQYRVYLDNLYCRSYARSQLYNAIKHFDCLENPNKLLALEPGIRLNVQKAMVCLSKYNGCYEEYKTKLKNYGLQWVNEDTAFNGFLAIFNHKHDTLPDWVKQVQPLFHDDEKLFLRFLAVTGLRKNKALTSFNMIIDLNKQGKLGEYYNDELSTLEHFKYGRLFLRGTKNALISIVPKTMMAEIARSQPVSYNAIHCRQIKKKIPLRFVTLN